MLLSSSFAAKLELVFVLTLENAFSKRLCFKANRKNRFFEKNVLGTFKIAFCLRVGMFLSESQWKFGTFSILTLKQILWKTKTFLKKTGVLLFTWSYLLLTWRLKMHYFHTKLLSQKPMLRQIEWWVENGPITKKRVLPATALFFWKFCFSLRTSYKELILCTNDPNVYSYFS